jgi:diguanylate cyclase (GGDEF)-like protein/PAS domain S-box-containing protein
LLGRPARDLVDQRLRATTPAYLTERLLAAYVEVVATRRPTRLLHHHDASDPDAWLAMAVWPLDDGFVATLHDQSAEQRSLRTLAESEARFRDAADRHAGLVCQFLPDLTITYVNEAFAGYCGVSQVDMVGRSVLDTIPPDHRAYARAVIASLGRDRSSATDEGFVLDADGVEHTQQWTTTATLRGDTVVHLQAVGVDVTSSARARRLVDAERAWFAALLDHSSDLVMVVDGNGAITYVSASVKRLLGWNAAVAGNAVDALHPDDRDAAIRRFDDAFGGMAPFRTTVRVGDVRGSWRWIEVIGTDRTADPDVGGVVLNGRDVTDEVAARQALAAHAELLDLQSRSTGRFIDVALEDADGAVAATLADLGLALGVDRTYVFRVGDDEGTISNTHEWCAPGIPSQLGELAAMPQAELPTLMTELRHHRTVHLPDVAGLDAPWSAEQKRFTELGLRSVLVVPMSTDGALVGFVGFDAVRAPRSFSDDEINVLRSAGAAISQLHARVQADTAIRRSEARYRALVAGVPDLLVRVDDGGRVLDWRPGTQTGFSPASAAVGRPLSEVAPEVADALRQADLRSGSARPTAVVGVEAHGASTPPRSLEVRITTAGGESIILVRDVTEQRQLQASLLHAANHDTLTGLANRRLFATRLEGALRHTATDRKVTTTTAVLYIDLDGFKVLNDSLGHDVGDLILVALAARLQESVRPGDVVARLGGDEFAVICHRVTSEDEARSAAERIVEALSTPVRAGADDHVVTASVGVVVADATSTPGDLLRDADAAMYRAKARGRRRVELFTPDIHEAARARHRTEHDLRRAIDLDQLRLHVQPVWSIPGRRWVAAEALVRWQHPERGLLGPAAFLAVAAEVGLTRTIGRWVLAEACRAAVTLRAEAVLEHDLTLWVNLAAEQLTEPHLSEEVCAQLELAGLPASALGVEVTETAVVSDVAAVRGNLERLRASGVRVALDDFGTGLSSLTYLDELPLDVVKLDGSFIAGIVDDARARDLVAGIVALVHGLGLQAVAEGVETAAQMAVLEEIGVDAVQGFHIGQAVPPAAMARLLGAGPTPSRASTTR